MTYAFDLTPFYEPMEIKPILQNSIVKHNGKEYRADRWQQGDNHCYVFINISNDNVKPFGKKPSEVKELITLKKLIVKKYI